MPKVTGSGQITMTEEDKTRAIEEWGKKLRGRIFHKVDGEDVVVVYPECDGKSKFCDYCTDLYASARQQRKELVAAETRNDEYDYLLSKIIEICNDTEIDPDKALDRILWTIEEMKGLG